MEKRKWNYVPLCVEDKFERVIVVCKKDNVIGYFDFTKNDLLRFKIVKGIYSKGKNGFKYFAPFTSAKESRSKLNNQLTLKLFSGDEFLGAIRFNNMLPCKDEHLTVIEIKNIKNYAYRSLQNKQYELINYTYKDKILEKAIKCYKIKTNNPSSYNASLCINFDELEKHCNNI